MLVFYITFFGLWLISWACIFWQFTKKFKEENINEILISKFGYSKDATLHRDLVLEKHRLKAAKEAFWKDFLNSFVLAFILSSLGMNVMYWSAEFPIIALVVALMIVGAIIGGFLLYKAIMFLQKAYIK